MNDEGRCIVARIMHGGMIHRQGQICDHFTHPAFNLKLTHTTLISSDVMANFTDI